MARSVALTCGDLESCAEDGTIAATAGDSPGKTRAAGVDGPLAAARGYRLPGEGESRAISAATVLALLGLWWGATEFGWVPSLVLPSPGAVGEALVAAHRGELQGGRTLFEHFAWSFGRVFLAFSLACATAIPIGILMGVSRLARGVFDPVIEFYRPLPPLAYLPLIVIWFGIDETAKILLLFLACFAPLTVAARAGVRSVAIEQIHAASSMGASQRQVIFHVILPAALPEILTGMRIAIGFAWTTLVAAELVAATVGLGQMVMNASNFLRTDVVVMGILVIGAVAWLLDLLMRWVESRWVPWKGRI